MKLVIACDCGAHDTAEPGRPHVLPRLRTDLGRAAARRRARHRRGARHPAPSRARWWRARWRVLCSAAWWPRCSATPAPCTFLLPAGAVLWVLVALPSLRRSYRRALEGIGELELQRSSVG